MKVTLRKHGINIVLGLCTTGKLNNLCSNGMSNSVVPQTHFVWTHIQPCEFLWIPDESFCFRNAPNTNSCVSYKCEEKQCCHLVPFVFYFIIYYTRWHHTISQSEHIFIFLVPRAWCVTQFALSFEVITGLKLVLLSQSLVM